MNRLITIIMLTIWSLVIFTSCGIEIRHKGKVKADVTIKVDMEMLEALCREELNLVDIPEEELTDEEKVALDECITDKYAEVIQSLENADD